MRILRRVVSRAGSDDWNHESGFVLVWASVMMTTLIGICAFSVDLGNWYLHIERAQRAADSAALDGAVYLPGNITDARATAKHSLAANGVAATDVDGAIIEPAPNHPDQLLVTVPTSFTDSFLGVLGIDPHHTFKRTGIGTSRTALHTNQGSNMLGGYYPGTPWGPIDPANGHYWVGIEGKDTKKGHGDRFATETCGSFSYASASQVDGCSAGDINDEYSGHYDFDVTVRSKSGGGSAYLLLQAFDPGYAKTGWDCTDAHYNTGVTPSSTDYCPGDWRPGPPVSTADNYSNDNTVEAPSTTYSLVGESGARPCTTYPGTQNASSSISDPSYSGWIHKWVLVCPAIAVDLSQSHRFVLRVNSGRGEGENNFLLRAGLSSSSDPADADAARSGELVNLSADKNLAVFDQYAGGKTTFAITQVPSNYAGQHVRMQFFDIGDAGKAGTLSLSSNAITNMARGDGSCTYTPDGGASVRAPIGTCGVKIDESDNGKTFTIDWQVPSDYSCEPTTWASSGGCWLYVNVAFPADAVVTDFSTWTLEMPGAPVRLVQNTG